jgi:hypothetical protein
VAVVSTFPPKYCGLATFTAALLQRLRGHPGLPGACHIGVVALADPAEGLAYTDAAVDYELKLDLDMPSPAMLEAVHFMHKTGYTHVIIQQVGWHGGLLPRMRSKCIGRGCDVMQKFATPPRRSLG